MGTDTDAPTATVYGNFKCPYTRDFVFGNLEPIIEEFVVTGRLTLEFSDLAYEPGSTSEYWISDSDPRIASAGLAVWDEDPDSYWQFYHDTFADAPTGYVDYDELASRARSADVSNVDALIDRAEAGAYDAAIERAAATADEDGISFTPQLELAGDTAAPHHDTRSILDWIEARLEDAPAETDEDEDAEEEPAEPEDELEEKEPKDEEDEETEGDAEDEETEEQSDDETEEPDAETGTDPEDEGDDENEQSEGDETGVEDEDSESELEAQPDETDESDDESADETTGSDDTDGPSGGESTEPADETEIDDDCPYR
ncbi:thioredoxin domain-containing protein [Natronococcus wangiae]|uniref:thioredoxin domain-containing protein n=1 Tax=Natronococcus wangiae TaxID=3068275 RepID=UPI00273F5D53|nr:thioredoxin domain-containing protein [Natronococcus sp. AD5]